MGLLTPIIRRQRFAMVEAYCTGDLLDVGCGQAGLIDAERPGITSYTGVDYRPELVEALARRHPQHTFVCADLDEGELQLERRFDTVLMVAFVEHICNQKLLMRQVKAALKPEGRIVLTTPTPFGNDIVHRYGALLGLFSGDASDDHVVIFNRKRLDVLAQQCGLRLQHYRRFQLGCNQLAVLGHAEAQS